MKKNRTDKYHIMVIDDLYDEAKSMYVSFLSQKHVNIGVEFNIIPVEYARDLVSTLQENIEKIDGFFIDARLDASEKGWSRTYNFDFVLTSIETEYKNRQAVIPPIFLISQYWQKDQGLLSSIRCSFSVFHKPMHPARFYNRDEIVAWNNNANTPNGNKELREERKYILDEIKKTHQLQEELGQRKADIVLQFAISDEKNMAYSVFKLSGENDQRLNSYGIIYQIATIDKYRVAFVSQSNMGMTNAAMTTTGAILAFHPKIVIMTGICAGKKDAGVHLGDVIVAKSAFDYSIGKLKKRKMPNGSVQDYLKHKNFSENINHVLDNFINLVSDKKRSTETLQKIAKKYPGTIPNERIKNMLWVSPIACGPWVVDNSAIFKRVIPDASYGDCVALDMESYAVACTAQNLNTPWLVIKVVQDYANGKKENDEKDVRDYASYLGPAVINHYLSQIMNCVSDER